MKIIGVDLGGTKILGVRSNEHGSIEERILLPTNAGEGLEPVVSRLVRVIEELMPPDGVSAIGLGVPGPLDPVKGEIYEPPNLPGWVSVPLYRMLRERLHVDSSVPIVLVNDANAAALAEYKFGAARREHTDVPIRHLIYLTISTGIGGGVIIDGEMLLGADGIGAELGHIVIDCYGQRCPCGNIGCLEAMASGTALAREAAILVASRRKTGMAAAMLANGGIMTAKIVVDAALAGDPEACTLMEREGMLVGVGVVSCIHLFNPQLVVIGGGVSNAGELLFKPVRETVDTRVMPAYRGTYRIVPAVLGSDIGALGAVAAAVAELQKAA